MQALQAAPPWSIDQWFNTQKPPSLESLRGKVIVLEVFQMLCPGCVSLGLPQAARVFETFSAEQVAVIGLHSVFEHHAAMTPQALAAFIHEYRIPFPVAVDRAGANRIPQTMLAYNMQGTPTLILIDAAGMLRHQHFGQVSDLLLGAQIAQLLAEAEIANRPAASVAAVRVGCDAGACAIDGGPPRAP